jgi:1-acyl-sn-glycerol-3-phosphate acyltransferase
MKFFRVVIKFLLFGSVLFLYFLASLLITLLSGGSFQKARPYLAKLVTLVSKAGLKIIGIKVVQNLHPINPMENYLIVSNHLSYIDVLVISSLYPSCFVTSKEMKETFFLGQLCLLGGCLFVDRKNRQNIHNEVRELTCALDLGLNVAIFPEATSTDGSSVIPFKRPLFQAAIDSHSKVLPVCLNYRSIDSVPVTLANRDIVCWYGDMTFFSHAVKLFSHKRVVVELNVLPRFKARDYEDKNELALKCHEIVSGEYSSIL